MVHRGGEECWGGRGGRHAANTESREQSFPDFRLGSFPSTRSSLSHTRKAEGGEGVRGLVDYWRPAAIRSAKASGSDKQTL